MLYPTTVSPEAEYGSLYMIPNSALYVFPFTLAADQVYDLTIVHTAGVLNQDHSIRSWVGNAVGNGPIYGLPAYVAFWHPNRTASEIITIHDTSISAPDGKPLPLALAPGNYFIHVQNLSNAENAFSFDLTDIT